MTPLAFSAPDASLFRAVDQRYPSFKNDQPSKQDQNHFNEESTVGLTRSVDPSPVSHPSTHEETSVSRKDASQLEPSSNTEGKTSAVYAPLPDANSYIRLLRIQSVEAIPSEATQIRCVLEIFAIEQAPPYNAISYTWGPPTPTQSIYVDGQPREVRENCKAVLLQAYGWGPGEYYWIDAICIDQSNLEEKGSQVALMGDLFGKAKIVLACVGEHADDSELLYAMLERSAGMCGRMGSVEDKYLVPGPLVFEFILWAVWNETETALKMYRALKAFLGRPYFTRVWVYQELFLARNVTIFCGKSYLPIKLFLGLSTGAFWLWFSEAQGGLKAWIIRRTGRLGLAKAHTHHRLENPFLKAGSFTQNRLRFDELIRHVSDLSCEDPRDMVYAIRSIADWKDKVPIQPDYSRDRFDLALDFMEHLERGGFSGNFPSFVNVTQYLELHTDPPPGLEEAVRRRMTPEAAMWAAQGQDEAMMRVAERDPTSRWDLISCRGSCVMQNDGEGLHVLLGSSGSFSKEDPSSCTRTYKVRRGLDNPPFKLKTSIAATPNVRAGDWIISASGSLCLKLVVRKQVDGPFFWIVGHAFVPVTVKLINIFNDAKEFTLFLDTEDALVSASLSPGWRDPPFEYQPAPEMIKRYIETGVCGSPGSSFCHERVLAKSPGRRESCRSSWTVKTGTKKDDSYLDML